MIKQREEILRKAENILQNTDFAENPLLLDFAWILKHFKRLQRSEEKLVKISDLTQKKLTEAMKKIQTISEMARHINESLDFDQVFKRIVDYYQTTYSFDGCVLALTDKKRKYVTITNARVPGRLKEFAPLLKRFKEPLDSDEGVINRAIRENRLLFASNVNDRSKEYIYYKDLLDAFQIRSMLIVPITISEVSIGVFVFFTSNKTITISQEQMESIDTFSNLVSIAVKNSKIHRDKQKTHLHQVMTHLKKLKKTNKAYQRFVPAKFLQMLGKKEISDIQLGDHIEDEMTILFADIRSFTSMSETMSPKDNFMFLNSYLRRVSPVIGEYEGFVDKYIGDAIMALFPKDPQSAIDAALKIFRSLDQLNIERQKWSGQIIKVGIGIHSGRMMLGTIGDEGRMEGTVISDAVNLASRIQDLTKEYGARLIISVDVFSRLSDPNRYNYRFLGYVEIKGKRQPVAVFEIFDADPIEVRSRKQKTKDDFEKAMFHVNDKKYEAALDMFWKILARFPGDRVVGRIISNLEKKLNPDIEDDTIKKNEDLEDLVMVE